MRFKPIQRHWTDYLKQIFPCTLCQMGRSTHAGLCDPCWKSLPWDLGQVERLGLNVHIACDYAYPLDQMIIQYKYHHQLVYAQLFAQMLLQLELPKVQAVVAMPISRERLCERGFNQALQIAKIFAKYRGLPVWQPVERINARHQKGLSGSERAELIYQQFRPNPADKKYYKRVLVIDDVVTTGNSLSALGLALQKVGCEDVHYCCVAGAQR